MPCDTVCACMLLSCGSLFLSLPTVAPWHHIGLRYKFIVTLLMVHISKCFNNLARNFFKMKNYIHLREKNKGNILKYLFDIKPHSFVEVTHQLTCFVVRLCWFHNSHNLVTCHTPVTGQIYQRQIYPKL